jgi:PAS domain S-box-containing protein
MIYELDPIGNFSFVNPILEQKTGFSKNDLIGSPYWALLHINDRARVVAFYESQYASRDERSYLEFQIVTKDNSVLWVGQNVRMFFDNDELQKVSAVSRDITSIKSSEQALQAERILLRTIIDNIPINIYAKDTLSRKILANKAEYVFVGAMSEREVIGKTDFDLYPEFTARRSQEEDLLVFGGKNILNKETINTRKDGSFTWLLTSKVPLRDVEGTIIGLVGISIDITEQRLAQQKLERSEKLYRLVSENSQDVISLHKLDGVFEFITSSSITLHGYEPEELIGKNGLDFMHPDDAERIKNQAEENLVKMQNHEPLPPMQFRIASRHKGYIWVENLIKPIFESGKLIGFQSAVRNIAAQKLHEQALQEAKVKAEEATKAKTQFLSMMSHEIRTPLNGILGITNILLSENPRQDQLENLNLLKFSGENLLSIINDILDFSKVESGKMVLEHIQFNLRELVDQTVRLLHDRAIRNGLDLRMNLDNDIPAFVMGDPVRLGQVLNNLLGNAIKFTERGFVEISIQVVERNEDRHHLRISIKDTGIGIPEDKLDTVFERFSQASPDTMRKYGGTGLGLSITKKILQLMDSEIHLTSRLGQGSEFSFDITFTESAEPITKIPETVEHIKLSGNILLVEDNNVNQAVARKFLSKWGFTIVVAENGAEAVKAATSKAFDLILMDLHMPVMDGYEATRKIRSMGTLYFHDVPIIALTADVSREIKSNVKSSGMTDILEKPFKPGELYDILQKHLPGHAVEVPPEVAAKLTEFKLAVIESLMQQNIHFLEASLHKNRTALHIVGDGTLNKLIDEIRTSLREHNGDIAQLIIQFSSQADLLIRAFNRSSNIK